jgi:hypothetical protein
MIDFSIIEHVVDKFLLGVLAEATVSFGNSPVDERRAAFFAADTLFHANPCHSNVHRIARNDRVVKNYILRENQQPIMPPPNFINFDSIRSVPMLLLRVFAENCFTPMIVLHLVMPRTATGAFDEHGPIFEAVAIEHCGFEKCSIRNRNVGANMIALSNILAVLDPVNIFNVKLAVPFGLRATWYRL